MPPQHQELHDKMVVIRGDGKLLAERAVKLEGLYEAGVEELEPMEPITGDKCGGDVIRTYSDYFRSLSKLANAISRDCQGLADDPRLP